MTADCQGGVDVGRAENTSTWPARMLRFTQRTVAVGITTAAVVHASSASAEDSATVDVYGTLLPFFENVGTSGATQSMGFETRTNYLATAAHTGINHQQRFRMTSGTSNIGFRGTVPIAGDALSMIWQVESPAPVDGEGPSNWANRNSHAGFTGLWGSILYGSWDTPMRWATVTSINPIPGGYTGDMTAIIGTPGHGVPAWNADQTLRALFGLNENPVGFFRHEPNSVQYWSPNLYGFTARLMYSANEHRTADLDRIGLNPYVLSGSLGYDYEWLRLRAAAELHNDYFGVVVTGGGGGPFENRRTSQDVAYLALASVRLNRHTDYETRIVVTGDYLSYNTNVDPGVLGILNKSERPAFYGLIQQTFGAHNIWGTFGQAGEGSCAITGGQVCTTTGTGATYYAGGYMYKFTPDTAIYGLGYLLDNDVSARYTPFPVLESSDNSQDGLPNLAETSAGSNVMGIGIGFVHSFNARILGGTDKKPEMAAPPPPPPVPEPEEEAADEPPPPEPEAAAPGSDGAAVDE